MRFHALKMTPLSKNVNAEDAAVAARFITTGFYSIGQPVSNPLCHTGRMNKSNSSCVPGSMRIVPFTLAFCRCGPQPRRLVGARRPFSRPSAASRSTARRINHTLLPRRKMNVPGFVPPGAGRLLSPFAAFCRLILQVLPAMRKFQIANRKFTQGLQ
jgi:hypothetical protein